MEIISVAVQKGIRIYTVKGAWQLDDTIQSKVMAMVFAMAAEIDRTSEPAGLNCQAYPSGFSGKESVWSSVAPSQRGRQKQIGRVPN